MPRSMADPRYRYSPWSPERRKAASEAGKARWAAKREAERLQREAEQRAVRPLSDLAQRIVAKRSEEARKMEAARIQYFASKTAIEELDAARDHLRLAMGTLKKYLSADDLA